MDQHLLDLDSRVAAAADAWLSDPRDAAVYARLVRSVEERRRYLPTRAGSGALGDDQGQPRVTDPAASEPDQALPDDDSLDDTAVAVATPKAVGEGLVGDPRTALERLRRGN